MYIIEVYDQEGKKSLIERIDQRGFPTTFTKKKTDALQWRERNQAIMYGAKLMSDMYSGTQIISMALSGFKVIALK